jgi:hypothetical protein
MTAMEIREKVQSYLGRGEVEEALATLVAALDNSGQHRHYDNALLLKAKWESIKQEQLKGVLTRQDYEVAMNKIITGIQTVVNDIDKDLVYNKQNNKQNSVNTKVIILLVSLLIIAIGIIYFVSYTEKTNDNTAIPTIEKPRNMPSPIEPANESKPVTIETKKPELQDKPGEPKKPVHAEREQTKLTEETKPAAAFIEVKVIVTKSDVNLKIDGEKPNYIGSSTGKVRTIKIQEGKYKFEVIEDGISCIFEQNISNSTLRIYPTCK